jgi:RHS repeat-associated protein
MDSLGRGSKRHAWDSVSSRGDRRAARSHQARQWIAVAVVIGMIAAGGLALARDGGLFGSGSSPSSGGVNVPVVRTPAQAAVKAKTVSSFQWVSSRKSKPKKPAKTLDLSKLTTPFRLVTRNRDGSLRAVISQGPLRVKRNGSWVALDPRLVQRGDGQLTVRVGYRQVVVASRADGRRGRAHLRPGKTPTVGPAGPTPPRTIQTAPGSKGTPGSSGGPAFGRSRHTIVGGGVGRDASANPLPLVSVETNAGQVSLAQPGAGNVTAQADGDTITFPQALSGGRDLRVSVLPRGAEHSVILPNADAPGSFDVVLNLPAGTHAEQRAGGIVFLDSGGREVGWYGAAMATDSSRAASGAPAFSTPLVQITGQSGSEVRVRVTLDDTWLHDPARVFPVTIDPQLVAYDPTVWILGDNYVTTAAPNTSYWGGSDLWAGGLNYGGPIIYRTTLYASQAGATVNDPHNWASNAAYALAQHAAGSCNQQSIQTRTVATYAGPWETWNNPSTAYDIPVSNSVIACGAGWNWLDASAVAQGWMNTPNATVAGPRIPYNGVDLRLLNEWDPSTWHVFYSGNTYVPPALVINYERFDAAYATTRPSGSTTWNRVAGQGSQIPVQITNNGTSTWAANGDVSISCHVKKADGTAVGDCPLTPLPAAIASGQTRTIDASVPGLDAGSYTIQWDLSSATMGLFSARSIPMSASETITVAAGDAYAQGNNPYVKFAGGVNTATGSYFIDDTDAAVTTAGPALTVTRNYNHRDPNVNSSGPGGWFGQGWSSSYETTTTTDANGDVIVHYPDGRLEAYTKKSDGTYAPPTGYWGTYVRNGDGTATLTDKDQTRYAFDAATPAKLTSITDANGRTLTLAYSGAEVSTVTDPASGRKLTYAWAGASGHRHVATVSTDSVSRSGQAAAPLVWHYTYTGATADLLASVCDPKWGTGSSPQCQTYGYDTQSRVASATRPLGNTDMTVTYTTDNRVLTTTNGVGNQTGYAYSKASCAGSTTSGNKTVVTDPRLNTTTAIYNPANALLCHTDELGKTRTFTYDPTRGFLASETDENGITTSYTSDVRGNVLTHTDGNAKTSYFTYDTQDHVLTDRDGRSSSPTDNTYLTTVSYDPAGNKLSSTPPSPTGAPLAATIWTYTDGTSTIGSVDGSQVPPKGLVVSEQKPGENPILYFYDAKGDRRRQQDPTGMVTQFDYDALGAQIRDTKTWTNADNSTAQAVTATVSDELNRPISVTDPTVTDPVTNLVHQLETDTSYDANGNTTQVKKHDAGGSSAPDADRTTNYAYDHADRENRTDYVPDGGSMTREFDPAGNVSAVTDTLGRRTTTTYTPTNHPDTVTLVGADTNALPNGSQNLTLTRYLYDLGGRKTSEFDALNHEQRFTYDNENRLLTTTLFAGGSQIATLEEHAYDPAGNQITQKAANASQVTTTAYFANNLVQRVTLDPTSLNRVTDTTYDNGGRAITVKHSIGSAGTTEETDSTYYPSTGLVASETVKGGNNGTDTATSFGYDTSGLKVAETDPRGNVTNYTYDPLGRQTTTALPAVPINGGTSDRPTTTTGYTTFGEQAQTKDANGNVTATSYDDLGRRTQIQHPAYTPPSGGAQLTPTETYGHDLVGNMTSTTDRRGNTTTFAFDMLNRNTTKTDPQVTGASAAGVTTFGYDQVGNQTQTTDPNGITTTATFDPRNRAITKTVGGFTTTFGYTDLGDQNSITPPGLPATNMVFNAAREQTSRTEPGAPPTTTSYDLAGRPLVVTDPLGRTTTNRYDLGGHKLQVTQAGGAQSATTSYGYDAAGNQTSSTNPRGYTTTYAYDAANRLTGVTEPLNGDSIVTQYGYDRNANPTVLTDGNTNTTTITYNPWNQPETRLEPATPGQTDTGSRAFTTSYDAGGLPVQQAQPGAVTVTRTYDQMGRMTQEAGSGGGAPAASRGFGYDLGGRRTSATTAAGTIGFGFDPRGMINATSGPAGTSSYGYDPAGRMNTRTDAAGTGTFTWDNRNNLATQTDPLTHTTRANIWDNANQLSLVTYANPNTPVWQQPARALTYDGLGNLKTDTLAVGTQTAYSTAYGYDANSNVASQTIGPAGVAGAGNHTYTYDQSDRLSAWTRPDNTTTTYGWDKAGNRTQAGNVNFTYDARNRLTSETRSLPAPTTTTSTSTSTSSTTSTSTTTSSTTSTSSTSTTTTTPASTTTTTAPSTTTTAPGTGTTNYTWTPRDTLASANDGSTTINYTFDALNQLTQQTNSANATTVNYTYDALGRIATRNNANFAYAGTEQNPTGDGTWLYSRSPAGDVMSQQNTTTTTPAELAGQNRHGDLTDLFTPAGQVTDTTAYSPFGDQAAVTGTAQNPVGFQGDWTDPTTQLIDMGARWYDPTNDTFVSADNAPQQLRTPISLNEFTYANDDPLKYFDPDGHYPTLAQTWVFQAAIQRARAAQYWGAAAAQAAQRQAFLWTAVRQRQQAQQAQQYWRAVAAAQRQAFLWTAVQQRQQAQQAQQYWRAVAAAQAAQRQSSLWAAIRQRQQAQQYSRVVAAQALAVRSQRAGCSPSVKSFLADVGFGWIFRGVADIYHGNLSKAASQALHGGIDAGVGRALHVSSAVGWAATPFDLACDALIANGPRSSPGPSKILVPQSNYKPNPTWTDGNGQIHSHEYPGSGGTKIDMTTEGIPVSNTG